MRGDMLKLQSCAQGHYWETPAEDDTATICPACGQAAETMPLLDLAPSEVAPPVAVEPPPPPPLRDKDGRPVVAGYEILEDLGKDPTGVSHYRARHVAVNRIVILKVVFAREDPGQLAWGSLRNEATALSRLFHPNIVQVLDAGERERQLFYNAIEDVQGPTLAEAADGKPLPYRQALALIETLARAIHQAHQKHILHRCLKPTSIRLAMQNAECRMQNDKPVPPFCILHSDLCIPKITDFGLARRPVEGEAVDVELQGGLPYYLAPEQAWGRAREIGPATDIYALGVILYELICGRPPFAGTMVEQTLDAIQYEEPPPLRRWKARVPRDVEAICKKCLHKQPGRRYDSALELADDLQRVAAGYPSKGRRISHVARFAKWVRRDARMLVPVLFGVILGVTLVGMLLTVRSSPTLLSADRLREENYQQKIRNLENDTRQAHHERLAAEYVRDLTLAQRAADSGDKERVRELLQRWPVALRHWEWNYLHGNQRTTVFAADLPILCLDLSPDGHYIAVGAGRDAPGKEPQVGKGEAIVWDLQTQKRIWHIQVDSPVRGVSFSPDSTCLALVRGSAQVDRKNDLRVYYFKTGSALFPPHPFDWSLPNTVVYTPDMRQLLVITTVGKVHLLRADSGALIQQCEGLFSGSWLRGTHHRLLPIPSPEDPERLALISPDGGHIVTLLSLQNTNLPTELTQAETITYLDLAYDRQSQKLAAAAVDGTIRLWDLRRANQPPTILRGPKRRVTGVSFSSDGQRLASCGDDGTLRIWDTETNRELLNLSGYKGASGVRFRPMRIGFTDAKLDPLAVAHDNKVTVLQPLAPQ